MCWSWRGCRSGFGGRVRHSRTYEEVACVADEIFGRDVLAGFYELRRGRIDGCDVALGAKDQPPARGAARRGARAHPGRSRTARAAYRRSEEEHGGDDAAERHSGSTGAEVGSSAT